MIITRDVINHFFGAVLSPPCGNILSKEGVTALADWSEQQGWWRDFAKLHCLDPDWRTSFKGDPYWFSMELFRFLCQRSQLTPMSPHSEPII